MTQVKKLILDNCSDFEEFGLNTNYLQKYSDENHTYSLSALLKQNQRETQPHYFESKFQELLEIVVIQKTLF